MKRLIILIFTFISINSANAQWQLMDGPYTGLPMYCITVSGGNVYAGSNYGVYKTSNNGQNWDSIGLTNSTVTALLVNGNNIYAGTTNNLYLSSNNGINWSSLGMNTKVNSILLNSNRLFVSTPYGIYLTTNNGVNWAPKDTGITQKNITSLVISGTKMFAGTLGKGVYISTNNASSWSIDTIGLYDLNINTLIINGNTIFAATNNGLFHKSVNGTTWIADTTGLSNKCISSFAVSSDSSIYAGTSGGLFISRNYGVNWNADTSGIKFDNTTNLYTIAISDTNIFLNYHNTNTDEGSVFLSTNKGISWNAINTNIVKARVWDLLSIGNTLFATSHWDGLFKSTDKGQTWTAASYGMPLINGITSITSKGNNIYISSGKGVFTSVNNGISWSSLNNGLPQLNTNSISITGNDIYIGLSSSGVYRSSNNGSSWTAANSGLLNTSIMSVAASGTIVLATLNGGGGVYKSSNSGSYWSLWYSGMSFQKLLIFGSNAFGFSTGTLYKSNISYSGWTLVNSAFTGSNFANLLYDNNIIYAPTPDGRIFFTTNTAVSWDSIKFNNSLNTVACIVKDSNFFYAGCVGSGLFSNSGGLYRLSLKDTISTFANPINAGNTSGSGFYNLTDSCSVKAYINPGFSFVNWTENGVVVSTDSIYTFKVKANRNLIANFIPLQYSVTTISNPVNGGITLGSGTYNINQICTVKARPNLGYSFINWTENNNIVSMDTNYTFTVTANRNLKANFISNQFTITTSVNPLAGGSTLGSGIYNLNQTCSLKAIHAPNYNFINWTENTNIISIDSNYIFTVTANRTLVANFSLSQGISFYSDQNSINIYPNPTKYNLIIETNSNARHRLEIISALGQSIYKSDIYNKAIINVFNFPKGVYILKLNTENGMVVKKFIKE